MYVKGISGIQVFPFQINGMLLLSSKFNKSFFRNKQVHAQYFTNRLAGKLQSSRVRSTCHIQWFGSVASVLIRAPGSS